MAKDDKTGGGKSGSTPPFRESGSGADYDPNSNWTAERAQGTSAAGETMAGAPSDAGDGGFGPEGDYRARPGSEEADVLGQVNGDDSALIKEAQSRGKRKPDRRFTGGEGVDEPDSMG